MSGCDPRDPGMEALTAAHGSALPFLPTLLTALAIAALSLLCRAPSTEGPAAPAASAQATPAGADGFHPAPGASTAAPAVPAALAFARLHPLTLQIPRLAAADETAKAPATRASRPVVAGRRACTGQRCGETRRVDTAVRALPAPTPVKAASEPAAIPDPMRGRDDEDGLLPSGAIPFAATAVSMVESARKLGGSVAGGAASLGSAAVDLIAFVH